MGAPYTALHLQFGASCTRNEERTVRFCWTNCAFTGSCTQKKSFTVTVLDSAHRFRSCLA